MSEVRQEANGTWRRRLDPETLTLEHSPQNFHNLFGALPGKEWLVTSPTGTTAYDAEEEARAFMADPWVDDTANHI